MAKKKARRRPSSSGILLFIIGFLGCLLLFAGAGYIWWQVTDPDLNWFHFTDTIDASVTEEQLETRYSTEDRFTFAVYITDDNDQLQSFSLAMFCPDTQTITVTGIPTEYSLSADSETDTLLRRFRLEGVEAATQALSAVLPTAPDYYILASYSDVEAFFESLATPLIMRLPKDVNESAADGSFSIHLTEGEHAMSPRQIVNLLKCNGWQGGRRERADMHALLVHSYIRQFISEKRTLNNDYALLCNHAQTNLPAERFPIINTTLEYLTLEQKEESPRQIPATGIFRGAGATLRFMPDTTVYMKICSYFPAEETVEPTATATS